MMRVPPSAIWTIPPLSTTKPLLLKELSLEVVLVLIPETLMYCVPGPPRMPVAVINMPGPVVQKPWRTIDGPETRLSITMQPGHDVQMAIVPLTVPPIEIPPRFDPPIVLQRSSVLSASVPLLKLTRRVVVTIPLSV